MNVLSLFNGISAMHLALDRAEINYNKAYGNAWTVDVIAHILKFI